MESTDERSRALRKLHLLRARLDALQPTVNLRLQEQYYEQLVVRLTQR